MIRRFDARGGGPDSPMNVVPGSSFFQTVPGSAASTGGGRPAQAVQAVSHGGSATDQRPQSQPQAARGGQELRFGPPGTNLDVVV